MRRRTAALLCAAVLVGAQAIPAHAVAARPATGLATGVMLGGRAAAVAAPASALTIELDRETVVTPLGGRFRFTSTFRADATGRTSPSIAHLNIVSLDPDVYVDPEDWSSERTRYLGPLAPGSATAVTWSVQAVTSGHVLLYVTLSEPDAGGAVVASPGLLVDIGAQPTRAGQGSLPLAIGVPALLLALVLGAARRRRVRSRPQPVPVGSGRAVGA
jgi:hypothetical protein